MRSVKVVRPAAWFIVLASQLPHAARADDYTVTSVSFSKNNIVTSENFNVTVLGGWASSVDPVNRVYVIITDENDQEAAAKERLDPSVDTDARLITGVVTIEGLTPGGYDVEGKIAIDSTSKATKTVGLTVYGSGPPP